MSRRPTPDLGGDPIETWNTFWWPAMQYQLQAFGDRWRELADPALLVAAGAKQAGHRVRSHPRADCIARSCTM